MTTANKTKTPGGQTFAPLVANQLWRASHHEHACFGLSSPWSFPSRSCILKHATLKPWLYLRRLFHHETFRPLFSRLAQFPIVLGYTRLLVDVDPESSEVVQKTPHPLFFLPSPRSSRPPPVLRASRTLVRSDTTTEFVICPLYFLKT